MSTGLKLIVGALLLSMCMALITNTAVASERPIERTPRKPEGGLLFYAKADYAYDPDALRNPNIVGALFQIIWSEVEKEKGRPDWTQVDQWIRPWIDAGKKVALRIMWSTSGYWQYEYYKHPTPQWVWDDGAKYAYHALSRTEIPLIWDPIYMDYAARFMRAVDARYGTNPNVLIIDVTPGAETNPYRFGTIDQSDPAFRQTYSQLPASDGNIYTDALWLNTINAWINLADECFQSGVPLLVTLNTGSLNPPDNSTAIGSYAVEKGFYVGQNGLSKNSYLTSSQRQRSFVSWSSRTKLFFEMVASTDDPRVGSLTAVMQAAKRVNASYLNVYPEDVLRGTANKSRYGWNYDAAYEEALRQGAEMLGRP